MTASSSNFLFCSGDTASCQHKTMSRMLHFLVATESVLRFCVWLFALFPQVSTHTHTHKRVCSSGEGECTTSACSLSGDLGFSFSFFPCTCHEDVGEKRLRCSCVITQCHKASTHPRCHLNRVLRRYGTVWMPTQVPF